MFDADGGDWVELESEAFLHTIGGGLGNSRVPTVRDCSDFTYAGSTVLTLLRWNTCGQWTVGVLIGTTRCLLERLVKGKGEESEAYAKRPTWYLCKGIQTLNNKVHNQPTTSPSAHPSPTSHPQPSSSAPSP